MSRIHRWILQVLHTIQRCRALSYPAPIPTTFVEPRSIQMEDQRGGWKFEGITKQLVKSLFWKNLTWQYPLKKRSLLGCLGLNKKGDEISYPVMWELFEINPKNTNRLGKTFENAFSFTAEVTSFALVEVTRMWRVLSFWGQDFSIIQMFQFVDPKRTFFHWKQKIGSFNVVERWRLGILVGWKFIASARQIREKKTPCAKQARLKAGNKYKREVFGTKTSTHDGNQL